MSAPTKTMQAYIRGLRERKRWKQSEAAKACGWNQPKVSKLETGVTRPTLDDLAVLATVFRVSLNKLIRIRTGAE